MKTKISLSLIGFALQLFTTQFALAATPSIDISQLKDSDQVSVYVYSQGQCSHESNLWVGPSIVRSDMEKYDDNTDRRFRFKISAKELRDLSEAGELAVDMASVCDKTGARIEIRAAGEKTTFAPQLSHGGRHDAKISFKM